MSATPKLLTPSRPAPRRVQAAALLRRGSALALIGATRVYQCTLSPLHQAIFGPCCRFYPSCSQYFIQAVQKHGPVRGGLKGLARLCRCHPWHPGGIDLP